MTVADIRMQIPEFLRETFDRNLPALRDRLVSLHKLLHELFAGQSERLPECIKVSHDLAGSLGVFGLIAPSEVASQVEAKLRQAAPLTIYDIDYISIRISNLQDIFEV